MIRTPQSLEEINEAIGQIVIQPSTGLHGKIESFQLGYGRSMVAVSFVKCGRRTRAWFKPSIWRHATPLESLALQGIS